MPQSFPLTGFADALRRQFGRDLAIGKRRDQPGQETVAVKQQRR